MENTGHLVPLLVETDSLFPSTIPTPIPLSLPQPEPHPEISNIRFKGSTRPKTSIMCQHGRSARSIDYCGENVSDILYTTVVLSWFSWITNVVLNSYF